MIEVRDLAKHYPVAGPRLPGLPRPMVRAVDGVSFEIRAGEALGLVGESGSGKSTIGQMLLQQVAPSAGEIVFEGVPLRPGDRTAAARLRGRIQVVFQDPYDALNPRMRVRDIVAEPLRDLGGVSEARIAARVEAAIVSVGLRTDDLAKYPHQFSGGQRQRIGIARAIVVEPRFVVLDEPVSALDVSVQAQVVNLLMEIRERLGIAYLFISHNLAIVEHVCERVAILYLGRIVETLPTAKLHGARLHPYTRALIDAVPVPDPSRRDAGSPLAGEIPDPAHLPPGCRFAPRCPMAIERCRVDAPALVQVDDGHWIACHRRDELQAVAPP